MHAFRTWTQKNASGPVRTKALCGYLEQDDGTKVLLRIGTVNANNRIRRANAFLVDYGTTAKWQQRHPSAVRIPEESIPTTLNFWQSEDKESVVIMQNTSIWTWWIKNATWSQITLGSTPGRHVFEVPVRYAFGCGNIFITP